MGLAHDLPSRINEFVERTFGQLGGAEQIMGEHTILPFYLRFAREEMRKQAEERMRGPSIGGLKFQLGVLTSRFRAHHPLKLCVSCASEDRRVHGLAYWHVEHQLPGVWVCSRHVEPLIASDLKSTGVLRFQWILPDEARSDFSEAPRLRDVERHLLLARTAADLWKQPASAVFSPAHLMRTYRERLRARGLLDGAREGRLRLRDIGEQYAAHLASLRDVEELAALPSDATAAARDIARLAYRPRHGTHPIRHLCAIGWLFEDFDAFLRAYQTAQSTVSPHAACAPQLPRSPTRQDVRRPVALGLFATGMSATAVAKEIGVAVNTAMAWAAADGRSSRTRPQILVGSMRERLLDALRNGANRQEVASLGAVSLESVTRLLRTEIGLRAQWQAARLHRARDTARCRWQSVVAAHPALGIKALRHLEPGSYAWLYRNDRAWLDAANAHCGKGASRTRPSVDWGARDRDLAESIRRTALLLRTAKPDLRITRQRICQRLPQLRAKLAKLGRLPRCRMAIADALQGDLPKCDPQKGTP